jgi:hypothetical protein
MMTNSINAETYHSLKTLFLQAQAINPAFTPQRCATWLSNRFHQQNDGSMTPELFDALLLSVLTDLDTQNS